MEDAVASGTVKAIGIANFLGETLVDLVEHCRIMPAVDQIETHPFRQQTEMQKMCERYGIVLEAWSPLACGKNNIFTNACLHQSQGHTTKALRKSFSVGSISVE